MLKTGAPSDCMTCEMLRLLFDYQRTADGQVSQLLCLSNLENLNAVFINEGIPQAERLAKLNAIAISQMKVLTEDHRMLQLDEAKETESKNKEIPCNKSSFPRITRMTGGGSLCSAC